MPLFGGGGAKAAAAVADVIVAQTELPALGAAPLVGSVLQGEVVRTVGDVCRQSDYLTGKGNYRGAGKESQPTSYVGTSGVTPQQVLPTDVVRGVVGLDRQKFDAANEAKRKVHVCNGNPGTLDMTNSFCSSFGPCVPPWTAHFIIFCPCICAPNIYWATCKPHQDMEYPEWADYALVYTDSGVVGKRHMEPDAKTNGILWSGFDIDKVEVRRYDTPATCNFICCPKYGLDATPTYDPLTCSLKCGLLLPCCAKVCIQPDTPGLYHLLIESTHTTTEGGGKHKHSFATGRISLIALAPSPEACYDQLRKAAAAAGGPAAAAMAR